MNEIEELNKAINDTAEAGVEMLKKSAHPDHAAYTRTTDSGTTVNVAAKGHPKDKTPLHKEIWDHMTQGKDMIDMPPHLQTLIGKKIHKELTPAHSEWFHSDEGKMSRLHPSHVDNEGEINIGPHTLRHNYSGGGYVIESRMPHMNGKVIETRHPTFETAKRDMIRFAAGTPTATAGTELIVKKPKPA